MRTKTEFQDGEQFAAQVDAGGGDGPGEATLTQGLSRLAMAAVAAGAITGLIGALFRMTLGWADAGRAHLLDWAHQIPQGGILIPVLFAAISVGIARFLVRFAPYSSGSGVQHVEAVMRGESEPAAPPVIPVKFVGGALAIGAGLALGREGPTVQIGSVVGSWLARRLRMDMDDLRSLQAATAGAGLAVAFNAPLGGAVFTFEELARQFNQRLTVATLVACGVAIAVSRLLLGNVPIFAIGEVRPPEFWTIVPFLLFGIIVSVIGVTYSWAIVAGLNLFDRLRWLPVELRAATIGATVGAIAWFAPAAIGGGESLNEQVLTSSMPLLALTGLFLVRWFLGPYSYAAGTPGGLFAPLLVVGAIFGALFGGLVEPWLPGQGIQPVAFAMVGMATFYTAVVRSPVTGILLVVEMTANTTLLVPLLIACFGAMLVATILHSMPIYDTLRVRMLQAEERR